MGSGRSDVATLASRARLREEQSEVTRRFSPVSWAVLAFVVVGPIGGILCLSTETRSSAPTAVGACLILLAVILVAKPIWDAVKPNVNRRASGEEAVRVYLRSVKMGWWKGAWSCLSNEARQGAVAQRPAIDTLAIDRESVAIKDRRDLKAIWNDFISGGRSILEIETGPLEAAGEDAARVRVRLVVDFNVNRAPYGSKARQGVGIFDKGFTRQVFVGRWPVYRRDGRWYVLDAGLPDDFKGERTDVVYPQCQVVRRDTAANSPDLPSLESSKFDQEVEAFWQSCANGDTSRATPQVCPSLPVAFTHGDPG